MAEADRKALEKLSRLGWYHSIELPGGGVIEGFQSLENLRRRIAQFPIPEDLRGKSVLDIGAWDGWFSFEMERRGARVVAVDSAEQTRFLTARELLGSKVEYHIADVCRLSAAELGQFDIVLFLGVLYHVKNPILALEKVCELSRGMACVESYVTDRGGPLDAAPRMEFYESTELCGQFDNWVGPNTPCLLAFCRTAGFARVRFESALGERAHATCWRQWEKAEGDEPAPYLLLVENAVSRDHRFSYTRDDYVVMWMESGESGLTCDEVFPEIGPYGTRPVNVREAGGGRWQVIAKLPPGLAPGRHAVRVRARRSGFSNAARIAVDAPPAAPPGACPDLRIEIATDGRTWERNLVRTGPEASLSLWVRGLPPDCPREQVRVELDGNDLPASYVAADRDGLVQVNALLPSGMRPGDAWLTLLFRDAASPPVRVRLAHPE